MTVVELSRLAGPLPARHLARAAGSGALHAAAGIGLLATSAWLITRASQRPPVFELSIAIGAVQAFALGRGISRYLERLSVHGVALDALEHLRLWLFDAIEPLVPGGLRGSGSGAVLSGLVAEVDTVGEALATQTMAAIDVGASIVLGAALAALIAPAAAGALLVIAASTVLVIGLLSRLGGSAAERASQVRGEVAGQVMETVRSARELAVYGRQDLLREWMSDVQRRSQAAAFRRALVSGSARALATLAAGVGLIAVVLIGLDARATGRLDGVTLAVLVFVTLAVFDQLGALPAAVGVIADGDGAARKLVEVAAQTPAASEPVKDRSSAAAGATVVVSALQLRAPDHDAPIVDGVSFRVDPGERIAITGRTGAGKTSLLYSILHFLEPSQGSATIGGVDVRTMSRIGIARHVGWLAEETHVFAASLRDNLRLGRAAASDEECVAALERVGLEAWYASLPEGLDTVIGSGARPLSAGERQRLGMARALAANAEVLLLDEPTAHLDPDTSPRAVAELVGSAGERSVIVVTHEAQIEQSVDRVVRLRGDS